MVILKQENLSQVAITLMKEKLALIVDDSKSARFVLQRMLNDLNLQVDNTASAIEAIEYLKHNQPDIIFMDHMMPGMDGLEAVKQIKANPQTAVIPIIMYTAKDGDVYLGRARALGAVGVIPKTISATDLKQTLSNLNLIDPQLAPGNDENSTQDFPAELVEKQDVLDAYIDDLKRLIDNQTVELHRSMWLGIESVSSEIFNRLNTELEERLDKIEPDKTPRDTTVEQQHFSQTSYVLAFLLTVSLVVNVFFIYKSRELGWELEQSHQTRALLNDEIKSSRARENGRAQFIKWANNKVIQYPFNEIALNENRLTYIKELFEKARESAYEGTIVLQTHAGNFCLAIDESGNYSLANAQTSVDQCDYIGNYVQPFDESTTHQTLSFANYLSEFSSSNKEQITVEINSAPRSLAVPHYPVLDSSTVASEWNRIAQLNNRITVILKPGNKLN